MTTFVGPLVYNPPRLNSISTRSPANSLRDQSLCTWGCRCSRFHSALLFLGHTVKVYNKLWAYMHTYKIFLVTSVVKNVGQTTNYHVLQSSKKWLIPPVLYYDCTCITREKERQNAYFLCIWLDMCSWLQWHQHIYYNITNNRHHF